MKTPWFDAATQNPVRVGVYEVYYGSRGQRWSYWDGAKWNLASPVLEAAYERTIQSCLMYDPGSKWRGLLK